MIGDTIYYQIIKERIRQEEKWGQQNHHPSMYNNILMEEVGEVAEAILKADHEGGKIWEDVREELIQTAAVVVAMIESLDRNQLKK